MDSRHVVPPHQSAYENGSKNKVKQSNYGESFAKQQTAVTMNIINYCYFHIRYISIDLRKNNLYLPVRSVELLSLKCLIW